MIDKHGWISVNDYLPGDNVAVLVFDTKEPTGTRHIKIDHVISVTGQEKYYGRDRIWASEYGNTTRRIAYWQPLPEGPERDEKEIREWQT